jgi:hypothetical protein
MIIALMMEAARTSETSVDNYFTRQYIPEDKSELVTGDIRDNSSDAEQRKIKNTKISLIRCSASEELSLMSPVTSLDGEQRKIKNTKISLIRSNGGRDRPN